MARPMFPKSVLNAAKTAAERHPSDVPAAVRDAERCIRALPEFDELVDALITRAIRDLVEDARHTQVTQIKRAAGDYKQQPKVVVGGSKAVCEAAALSLFRMPIAGTTLGKILGGDLPEVADHEREKANGSLLNERLCRRLAKVVPAAKMVEEAVTENRLNKIFQQVSEAA